MRVFLGGVVAEAYMALAGLSALLAFSEADAWTVWYANGLTLGLLLALRRMANWQASAASAPAR